MLEVRLLGTFNVKYKRKTIDIPSRAAQSLFAYLLLSAGTAHRREKLAGLLWPDSTEESARDYLRHALWRIRKSLPARANYLLVDDLSLTFNASCEYQLDAAALERAREDASADELIEIVSAYEGELLPGFYDEWVVLEREHLAAVFESRMARLLSLLERGGRWLDILEWGEHWIKLGQKPEPAYRALMMAHAAKGDMSKVAATYERCVKSLREYGMEPSEPTRTLYARLKAGKEISESRPDARPGEQQKPFIRTNLPTPLTTFIGREKEVEAVVRSLWKNRLITLAGSGGVGKTRLAIQASRKLISKFKDGVWWVDLVSLNDPALVPQAVAQVLNLREVRSQPLIDTLTEDLRAKQSLLVLDNCEHLITACAQLADRLLSECRNLKLLATSREALDIPGETVWVVPSLSLPDREAAHTPAELTRFESIRLFLDRAEMAQPRFELSEHNAQAVVQICERLSGMPLAIELAAARVRMVSADEIAKRLDNRFSLLTGGSRMALPRHQTLRATIDWSYDLLPDIEKSLFRRLSVFVGGFTLDAAEAVGSGGAISKSQVVDLLGQLINKSLVIPESRSSEAQSETRFGMLETIREYARIKLEELGEARQTQDRHLDFYMRLGEEGEAGLFSPRQVAWLRKLEGEIDNIRAAEERSSERDEEEDPEKGAWRHEAGLSLIGSLLWMHERTYALETYERIKRMLAAPGTGAPTRGRAKALCAAGFILWELSRLEEARTYLEEAVAIYRELDDKEGLAWALVYLAWRGIGQGDYPRAQALFEEATAIAEELGPAGKAVMGVGLGFYGDIFLLSGDSAQAREIYGQSNVLLREVGEKNIRAYPERRMGYLELQEGNYAQASESFKESLLLNLEVGHEVGPIACLVAFVALAYEQKEYARAARILGAVNALLLNREVRLFPPDEAEHSHYLTALKAKMEASRFRAAYAEGEKLTLEQAIDLAFKPSR